MFDKIKGRLGLLKTQSDTPIGDALAKEMKIDLSFGEYLEAMQLHRMQYEQNKDNGYWVLTCDECGLWVFDSEDELFIHVISHSKEAINAIA